MATQPIVWGVHMGSHVMNRPVEGGYVAIGWQDLSDVREIPADREAYKAALIANSHGLKEGAIPVHAGILYRFVHEMQQGDIVVYPSKHDRMVNIGRFTGETEYMKDDPDEYPNRRMVKWIGAYPRNDFNQSALNEIGSAVTLFRIRRYAAEYLAKAGLADSPTLDETSTDADEVADDDTATVAAARQAEETTVDFVIRRITSGMSGYEFEEFVAHLLECMGHTARVTAKFGDGGVDVIAQISTQTRTPATNPSNSHRLRPS